MIQEDYVSFEVAKLLKEKGFDLPCHATYDTAVTGGKPKFSEYEVLNYFPYGMKNSDDKYSMVISAPTLQMAMKWLREEHRIFLNVSYVPEHFAFTYRVISPSGETKFVTYVDTYEQACEVAIKYCLENLI